MNIPSRGSGGGFPQDPPEEGQDDVTGVEIIYKNVSVWYCMEKAQTRRG